MFKWNSDSSWMLKFYEHISCLSWHDKNFSLKVYCAKWIDLIPREYSASTTISKVKTLPNQKNQINPMSNHLLALRGAGDKWGCTTWLIPCPRVGTLVWGSHDPGSIFWNHHQQRWVWEPSPEGIFWSNSTIGQYRMKGFALAQVQEKKVKKKSKKEELYAWQTGPKPPTHLSLLSTS